MPLVTRTSSQSTVYAQASAPTISEDGETWIDTDTGAVYTSEGGAWVPQSVGAIGSARQQLAVNSNADGLEYVSSLQSLMTAQADMIYASAANTPARLAKGTGGHFLRVNAGGTALEWAAAGATVTLTSNATTTTQAITSTSFVDVTNMTVTLPASGKSIITFNINCSHDTISGLPTFVVLDNGSATTVIASYQQPIANQATILSLTYTTTAASQIVKLQAKVDTGTVTMAYNTSFYNSSVKAMTVA